MDIECAGWSRFMLGAIYSPIEGTRTTRSMAELVDWLLLREGWWWAWCGGRYDFLAIADELHRRGINATASMSGSQITRLVVGGLHLVDAYFLCPMSKAKACGIVGVEPPSLGWECVCAGEGEAPCGGYCQISPRMSAARWRELEAYCAHDVKVEYQVLARIADIAREHDLELRGTIGGTAWATAQRWLDLPDADMRSSTWRRIAEARYGGRVFVGRARAQRGWQYDLSAAYPAALATTPVPIGDPRELGRREAGIAYRNEVEGVYTARVRVPETLHIPPLPWRHRGRLAYPVGQLSGTWTAPELRYAESLGVEIEEIHDAVAFVDGAMILFDDVIARWYGARVAAGKRTALGEWWKLLCNSLTGKLGEGPDRERVVMHPTAIKWCNPASPEAARAGCNERRCTGGCGAFSQLDRWGTIWSAPYFRPARSSHIAWNAYLVAATRIQWHQGAMRTSDPVYGDTDSLWRRAPDAIVDDGRQTEMILDGESYLDGAPGEVGDRLGQWEIRGDWYDWQCLGPKAYRYRDSSGAWVVRAAGVPHATDRAWEAMTDRDRELFQGRGVMTLKEAAGTDKGLFRRRYRHVRVREPDGWFGDRLLGGDGRTYPVDRVQVQERYEKQARRIGSIAQADPEEPTQSGVVDPGQDREGRGRRQVNHRLRRGTQVPGRV